MKERPIIMSAESVQAILDGRKTQTRRVVRPQPFEIDSFGNPLWGEPKKDLGYRYDKRHNPYNKGNILRIKIGNKITDITLGITNIRVERLQDITEDDAFNEGIEIITTESITGDIDASCKNYLKKDDYFKNDAISSYKSLWDKLNAKRGYSWDSNPFVWVIEFRRVEK